MSVCCSRFMLEPIKVHPQTHIYLGSVSPGEHFKYVNMVTPLPVLKKPKNGTLARQILGATDLTLSMHTQLDSGSNMGWVPPGHTEKWCVRQKYQKWCFGEKKNTWTLISKPGTHTQHDSGCDMGWVPPGHTLLFGYVWLRMVSLYIHLCVSTSCLQTIVPNKGRFLPETFRSSSHTSSGGYVRQKMALPKTFRP